MKRSPNKFKTKYKLGDAYKDYKKENPKGSDFFVERKFYMSVNKLMFEKIKKHMLEESDTITLPYNMGALMIIKKKQNFNRKIPLDYGTYRKEGLKLKHLNEHSNGYRFRFRWQKNHVIVKNRSYYSFIPCRKMCRDLAKLIKQGYVDYPQI